MQVIKSDNNEWYGDTVFGECQGALGMHTVYEDTAAIRVTVDAEEGATLSMCSNVSEEISEWGIVYFGNPKDLSDALKSLAAALDVFGGVE